MRNVRLIGMLIVLGVIGALMLIHPVAVQAEDICFEAGTDFDNKTGNDQTIYVRVFNLDKDRFETDSVRLAIVKEGEDPDLVFRIDLDDDDRYEFWFNTAPITRSDVWERRRARPCSTFGEGSSYGRYVQPTIAASAVVFFNSEAYEVYAADSDSTNGRGDLLLTVPLADVASVMANAAEQGRNLPIASGTGVTVYALSTGTCQMNALTPDNQVYEYEWNCLQPIANANALNASDVNPDSDTDVRSGGGGSYSYR